MKKFHISIVHIAASLVIALIFVIGGEEFPVWLSMEQIGEKVLKLMPRALALTVVLLPVVSIVFGQCLDDKLTVKGLWTNGKTILLPVALFYFMLAVYLPSESFISNLRDFDFTYQMLLPGQALLAILAAAVTTVLLSALRERVLRVAGTLMVGVDTAVYLQYMFLNRNLKLLDGEHIDWSKYTADILLSYLVWAVLLGGSALLSWKREQLWKRLRIWIPVCLGGVQLVTLVVLLWTAPDKAYQMETCYMSSEEQYVVSGKDNIVMFILDAMDNSYIKELQALEPGALAGLEDFTIYTDTCSVFDSTPTSITQMLTGMGFAVELTGEEWYRQAWGSERTKEFYKRLHEANYRVNGYSLSSDTPKNYEGRFDNYRSGEQDALSYYDINRGGMCIEFCRLSLYRALPVGWKHWTHIEKLNFADVVVEQDIACYDNEDYRNNLKLTVSETDQNYLIVEHLVGTHSAGVGEELKESKYLLDMLREYIRQMKELGVYDDATIIVTADHGRHNDHDSKVAGTPVFLMKRKGESRDSFVYNHAPIYHEDIQATLLACAGLYDEERDGELFGRPVFGIEEGMPRERSWYDRQYDIRYPQVRIMGTDIGFWTDCNVYYAYTYIGDTETLTYMVENGEYTQVYPMTDNKG